MEGRSDLERARRRQGPGGDHATLEANEGKGQQPPRRQRSCARSAKWRKAVPLVALACVVVPCWLLYVERPFLFPSIAAPPAHFPAVDYADTRPLDVERLVELWDPTTCRCNRSATSEREQKNGRYVFMFSDLGKRQWITATKFAVMTLQMTCPKYGISVLWNAMIDEQDPSSEREKAWFERRGVEIVRVVPRRVDPVRYNYIKLHVWQMTEYDMVALYDADMIFLRSPDSVFAACARTGASFCATRELLGDRLFLRLRKDHWWKFWSWILPEPWLRRLRFRSFNAGAFVTKPDPELADRLFHRWVENYKAKERAHQISEQLMLNHELERVGWISSTYNLQKAATPERLYLAMWRTGLTDWPVTIHRKYFGLKPPYLRMLLTQAQRTSTCSLPPF